MTSEELKGILAMFGPELPDYQYFKDKYALMLTAWAVGEGRKVADVKRSPIAGLLQKDILRQHCARFPLLRAADLLAHPVSGAWTFRRSLDEWGQDGRWGWEQVSRPGKSLVFRLDFGREHDRKASKLRVNGVLDGLEWRNHMHFSESFNLAWCRLDLDWETGEVLIEEIQNDWLRHAEELLVDEQRARDHHWYHRPRKAELKNDMRFVTYHAEVLAPLHKVWSEAMLCATLEFIRNDLGLQTVFMHTHECGTRLKDMVYCPAPRSLYQDLPKRFCFAPTTKAPAFLSRSWGQLQRLSSPETRKRFERPFSFWKMEL